MNDHDHLCQMERSSSLAVGVDLIQQDSGHHVSGEVQVSCTDGRDGQWPHLKLLSLLQTKSDDAYQRLTEKEDAEATTVVNESMINSFRSLLQQVVD